MPRRKQIRLSIRDLPFSVELRDGLATMPELKDYDLLSTVLTLTAKKSAPVIKDVDRAIANLKHYADVNKHLIPTFMGEQLIRKKDLAHMMKISRPTLDQWIKNGFIERGWSEAFREEIYQVDKVVVQLKRHRK